jgi:hypothetical protein
MIFVRKTNCQYPLGTQDGCPIFCNRYAAHRVEGLRFCELHTLMAIHCLDMPYTDGTTPRQIIERNHE